MRENLVRLRKERGYSQDDMSKLVPVSRSHYSQIETGDKSPSFRLAVRIKRTLDTDDDDIFLDYVAPGKVRENY